MYNKKLKKKVSTTLMLTMTQILLVANQVYALSFTDVSSNHWAKDVIQEFVNNGYIGGYSDNTFKPEKSITRAEFIKIVNNVYGYKVPGTENFKDISEGSWYYNDVCIAMNEGYINGYTDNTFRPNKEISREEVAAIITNIEENKDTNYDKTNKFQDANQVSIWAKSSVEGAIEAGYIGGYSNNTIRPKANITRAESVAMLSRIDVENPDQIKIMYTTGDPIVNVRKGPGTNYDKLGELPKGTKVEVVKVENNWAKIKYKNDYAYVSMNYLVSSNEQKPLPSVPSTPTYIDSPQHPDIISQSQDVYQSKVELKIEKSGDNLPKSISIKNKENDFDIHYTLYSNNKQISGKNGEKVSAEASIEGIKISLKNAPKDYHIFYRTKIKNQGWQAWVKDETISGQVGNNSVIEDIQVRLVVSDKTETMVKPTIGVDIGHNVARPVKAGANGVYKEDDLTKAVGEKLIYKLRQKGYNVVNTLPTGRYTQSDELKYRVETANKNEVEKFVSIHFNSHDDVGPNGTEVYYNRYQESKTLASSILNNVVNEFKFENRGIKAQTDLYILENANMPAVLVEACFLTNQGDMEKFIAKGEKAYDLMANSIVDGITK